MPYTLDTWINVNGCNTAATSVTQIQAATCTTWATGCAAASVRRPVDRTVQISNSRQLTLCNITGGGHSWPTSQGSNAQFSIGCNFTVGTHAHNDLF